MKHLKGWRPKRRIDGKWTRCNLDRALAGETGVMAWSEVAGSSDDRTSDLGDCLADLCHYAAWLGIEPSELLETAITHFEAER